MHQMWVDKKGMTFNKGCEPLWHPQWLMCDIHGLICGVFLMWIFSDQFLLLHSIDRPGIGSFSWTASFIIMILIGLNDKKIKVALKSSPWVFKAKTIFLQWNKAVVLMAYPMKNQCPSLTNNTSLAKQMRSGLLYFSLDSNILLQQHCCVVKCIFLGFGAFKNSIFHRITARQAYHFFCYRRSELYLDIRVRTVAGWWLPTVAPE